MARFSVDTHLFRELGELLVGRDSTALVELIKNAYDADATEVTVSGFNLDDPRLGVITITDNGNGMTSEEFTRGFLRIASRQKDLGNRRSPRFLRRFTGAKGIGRLAAHKLAQQIEVSSISIKTDERGRHLGVDARIDWNRVEAQETLDEVTSDDAVRVISTTAPTTAKSGTTITLRRLRRPWTDDERARFMEEVQTFEPPPVLSSPLPQRLIPTGLIVEIPLVRDEEKESTWAVKLEGEFEPGEAYWQNLAEAADWVIEIDALSSKKHVRYSILPTAQTVEEIEAAPRYFEAPHPDPREGPFFQARILVRYGRAWRGLARGVRVFMEGFRVLPYGESRNDWLGIEADVNERTRTLELPIKLFGEPNDKDEGLNLRPNKHYFGGVFITQKNAPSLRMLVNREGFVPEAGYEHLTQLVRRGVDLSARVIAAARHEQRTSRRTVRAQSRSSVEEVDPRPAQTDQQARIQADRVRAIALETRNHIVAGDLKAASETVLRVITETEALASLQDESISEHALMRILASVGMQLAAFVHEIQALLGMAEGLERSIDRLRVDPAIVAPVRRQIAEVLSIAGDLRRSLERQASYLLDVVTPDARRRRSRQPLRERFSSALKLVAPLIERRGIVVDDEIPANLKSPPMFPAEISMVFTNLLTNAVKAAGEGGRILAWAGNAPDGRLTVRLENSGVTVQPEDGERWFTPFESTTSSVDPVLGQGMGLGLPITRKMLEEYGAEIRFVRPSPEYATAIQIFFPA